MTTYIDPSRANFEAFKKLPRDKPIEMLNLLLYRERADYPGITKMPVRVGVGGRLTANTAAQAVPYSSG